MVTRTALAGVLTGLFFTTLTGMPALGSPETNRVTVTLTPPKDAEHQYIYELFKKRNVAGRLQEFLSPFRLPRTLNYVVAECAGEADASYDEDSITMCYEYIDEMFDNMPSETTPAGVAPMDAAVGPFFDTSLHEFGHALFDMLDLPVFGREEDAADQVAAYIYLQLGQAEARRLIMGTAYAYLTEAKGDDAPRTAEEYSEDFAGEHSVPEQRAYNLLCMAYGADPKLFADVVKSGQLPRERADQCEDEYDQVGHAYDTLVGPHIDRALEKKILKRSWLRKPTAQIRRPGG